MARKIEVSPVGPSTTRVGIFGSPRGLQGVRGPAGLLLIRHGDDPDVPRPTLIEAPIVLWRGSVQPNNWNEDNDLWIMEE